MSEQTTVNEADIVETIGAPAAVEDITSDLDFSGLAPLEVKVTYKGSTYILRGASAGSVIEYRSACMSAATFNADGRPTAVNGKNMGAELKIVADNLFPVIDGKPRKHSMTIDFIKELPYEMQDRLFERLQKITPKMSADDTEENLTKRIHELLDRYKKLRAKRESGDLVKN